MSVQSREKIALAVFAALIVLSLFGLGWYLIAGHSWNVAASNIDDTFGSMDGYTAIVYEGTAVPKAVDEKGASGAGADAGASSGAKAADVADAASPEAGESKDPERNEHEAEESASKERSAAEEGLPERDAADGTDGAADADADAGASSSAGTGTGTLANGTSAKAKPGVTVAEAQRSYEDKKATVFSLDTVDLDQYGEGTILKKGDHRFGVFSVTEPTTVRALEKQVAYFAAHKVDFIVAITPDKAYVEGASGIDIVVSTQDEDLFVMGETIDGTFYVDAPEVGKVGTILISPSNVVSAKVIEEL
ncbi:alcohol dehydrogenase [Eggerthella sp. NSJ-70]|uniref:Alcohol dehydrogenase n=1 Tax=Eggerthella hominis TaxID=2763043 RepID=A0ABR7BNX1_9ACTN|nr:alcohol dehydrogenase [Eggerthella hominis]MBC5582780.1 alcohol dehydrogenase [Eggerthella hominis]